MCIPVFILLFQGAMAHAAAVILLYSCLIARANLVAVTAASKANSLSLLMPDVQPKVVSLITVSYLFN